MDSRRRKRDGYNLRISLVLALKRYHDHDSPFSPRLFLAVLFKSLVTCPDPVHVSLQLHTPQPSIELASNLSHPYLVLATNSQTRLIFTCPTPPMTSMSSHPPRLDVHIYNLCTIISSLVVISCVFKTKISCVSILFSIVFSFPFTLCISSSIAPLPGAPYNFSYSYSTDASYLKPLSKYVRSLYWTDALCSLYDSKSNFEFCETSRQRFKSAVNLNGGYPEVYCRLAMNPALGIVSDY